MAKTKQSICLSLLPNYSYDILSQFATFRNASSLQVVRFTGAAGGLMLLA